MLAFVLFTSLTSKHGKKPCHACNVVTLCLRDAFEMPSGRFRCFVLGQAIKDKKKNRISPRKTKNALQGDKRDSISSHPLRHIISSLLYIYYNIYKRDINLVSKIHKASLSKNPCHACNAVTPHHRTTVFQLRKICCLTGAQNFPA